MEIQTKLRIPVIREFLSELTARYNTENLTLIMAEKPFGTKDKASYGSNNGICSKSRKGFKITIWIDSDHLYPIVEEWGTKTIKKGYIYDRDQINSRDESLAWILGHEFWHYLCFTNQESGNVETKANANGFKWLRKYRKRYGSLQNIKK
jgi:hypothetical protein